MKNKCTDWTQETLRVQVEFAQSIFHHIATRPCNAREIADLAFKMMIAIRKMSPDETSKEDASDE